MEQPEGDFRLRKMFQHDERDLSIMQRSYRHIFLDKLPSAIQPTKRRTLAVSGTGSCQHIAGAPVLRKQLDTPLTHPAVHMPAAPVGRSHRNLQIGSVQQLLAA